VALDALGRRGQSVAPDATAFVHRDGLFVAQFTTTWKRRRTGVGDHAQQNWATGPFHRR